MLLMLDDDEIRDLATFGLGTQLNDDSAEIRDALAARLTDEHVDTRHEALIGLARRRDPRGLKATLDLLERPDVWRLSIDAAGYYASPCCCQLSCAPRRGGGRNARGLDPRLRP